MRFRIAQLRSFMLVTLFKPTRIPRWIAQVHTPSGWATIQRTLGGAGFHLTYHDSEICSARSAEEARKLCLDYEHYTRTGEMPDLQYEYFENPSMEDTGDEI